MSESIDGRIYCSFCNRESSQVNRLLQGAEAYICDMCVDHCSRKLTQINHADLPEPSPEAEAPNEEDIEPPVLLLEPPLRSKRNLMNTLSGKNTQRKSFLSPFIHTINVCNIITLTMLN